MIVAALPAACYWLGAVIGARTYAFQAWSQILCLLPGLTGIYVRRAFYRMALSECGQGSVISFGTIFSHSTITIGKHVYIGPFGCLGDVFLGDDVLVGSHVSIANGGRQHGIDRLDIPVREQAGEWPRITIGQDSWLGDRAVVMADVGKHCVVGAGAVVTKPVPDYAIVVGVPAKVIASRAPQAIANGFQVRHVAKCG